MSRIDRFRKRKYMINAITMHEVSDKQLVEEFLNSETNHNKINAVYAIVEKHYDFKYDFNVSEDEAKTFLIQFKKDFNDQKFNQLINDCKKEVINSIVTSFGLGKVVAAYDKAGGNIDTIHNVRNKKFVDSDGTEYKNGVYATDKAKENYVNRGDYNSDEYHRDQRFIEINRKNSAFKKDGTATDYMSGEKIKQNDSHDLDHIVSGKEIHDDPGRILASIDGAELANTDANLKPTDSSINRSKKADSMEDFLNRKNKKIKELKTKDKLSEKEQKELKKIEKLKKIDDKKAIEADKKAREEQNSKINKVYYRSEKFAKDTVVSSVKEGAKMGIQQALGLVISEFFTALFDEILDIYKNGFAHGFDDDRFFSILKDRLKKIAIKVTSKWKDVAIAFKDGFISGFISNLVTTVINMFVTTGKRVVRIIREGLFSLFRAVKLLIFPPDGMTYEDAMHEAKKLIASGLIISLGVIAEEYIDKLIRGTVILEPFTDTLTSVFVGVITGLSITMVVYYIDQKKNDKEMVNILISDTNQQFDNLDILLTQLQI